MNTNSDATNVKGTKLNIPMGFVILVNNKIFNRFLSFEVSHSIDVVPMSFSMTYAYKDGEENTNILSMFEKATVPKRPVDSQGFLTPGAPIKIFLDKYCLFTGFVDSVDNGLTHGQHMMQASGRSTCQVITDGTTIQPNVAMVPNTLTSIRQVAEWLVTSSDGNQLIHIKDLTNDDTPQPLAGLANINFTTKTYDFLADLAQYEGKLLYDDRFGRLVIANPAQGDSHKLRINDGMIESFTRHRSNLGRFQKYNVIINSYNAVAGVQPTPASTRTAMDQTPSEIPNGKILSFASQASYPTSGNADGWVKLNQQLVDVTAKRNWGRGDVISLVVRGTTSPSTKQPWSINDTMQIDYGTRLNPNLSDVYVISDIVYRLSHDEHSTEMTLVRKESLGVIPTSITPPVSGVNNPDTASNIVQSANQSKDGSLNVNDSPPANAKPTNGGSK